MPFAQLLASLLARQAMQGKGGFLGGLRGLFGPRGPDVRHQNLDPGAFGGRSFVGRGLGSPEVYGHTFTGRDATPAFTLPGAGGGTVQIPELARAAGAGDPFATGAIGRQAQSGRQFGLIDELIAQLQAQLGLPAGGSGTLTASEGE